MKSSLHARVGLLVPIAMVLMVFAAQADIETTVEKKFDVKSGGSLYIESDLGSIEVKTSGSDQVNVTVYQRVDASSSKEASRVLEDLKLDFDQTGNDVRITARYDRDRRRFWKNNPLKLRFVVTVPRVYNVDLKTAGGSISVDDLQGEVISKTSGGSLKFGEIVGTVTGKTSGGSITLKASKGDAELATSGGSITIGQVDGTVQANTSGGSISIVEAKGSVTAHTSGGSINVEEVYGDINAATSGGSVNATITKQPQGPCRLTTSGGSVNVHLADGIKLDLDASTSGGRVRTDFEVTVKGELGRSKLHGKINGGGPELYLRTTGGNINITKVGK